MSEREAARRLNVNDTTVLLCLAVVRGREKVLVPTSTPDLCLYESVVTTNKIKEVNTLPEERRAEVLQAVVENQLSTDETKILVSGVRASKSVDAAATELVNAREARKPPRHLEKKEGITRSKCRVCRTELRVKHLADGTHRILRGEEQSP